MSNEVKTSVILFVITLVLGWGLEKLIINPALQKRAEKYKAAQIEAQADTIEEEAIEEVVEEEEDVDVHKGHSVVATYYNPVEAQCDDDPLTTASGKIIDLGKLEDGELLWIAISRDLLKYYSFGDRVEIVCREDPSVCGIYTITDTMNERFTNTIDFLWPVSREAGINQGRWHCVMKKIKEEKE